MDDENIPIAMKTLKILMDDISDKVLKSIVLSNNYSKAEEITAYFFSQLNVDDIYSQEEYYNFVNEVYFMMTTN